MSDEGTTRGDATAEPAAVDVRVTAGNPSEEEIAAVTAVLAALAEQRGSVPAEDAVVPPPSAWDRSRRGIRSPIEVGRGRWRGFSG